MKGNKALEGIFIIAYIGIFLWMCGPFLKYLVIHDRPMAFVSTDSYAWYTYSKGIYDSGSFKYTPSFLNLGMEGFTSPEPPLFLQLNAFMAHATGLPLYDIQILLVMLMVILIILIFFVIVRSYNPFLAYLSLPLCIITFTWPFDASIIFGIIPAVFGFVFLFVSFFMMLNMDLKYSAAIMGLVFSAMVMGHTVRVFEFVFFGGVFIIIGFVLKRVNLGFLKKLAIAGGIASITTVYHLVIFWQRYSEGSSFNFVPLDQGARYLTITLKDFKFGTQYVILAGLALCVYFLIKERKNIKCLIFTFPLTGFLLVHFFRVNKIYQVTFFWPSLLGLALGLVIFFVLRLNLFSVIHDNKIFHFWLSLFIAWLLILQIHYASRGYREIISDTGTTPNQAQWSALMWIRENTKPDDKILFVYFNDYPEDFEYLLFPTERQMHYIPLEDIDFALKQGCIVNHIIKDYSVPFFYKRDPDFPLKIVKVDKSQYVRSNMTVCDFDYVYGKRSVDTIDIKGVNRQTGIFDRRTEYVVNFMNELKKRDNFELVFLIDEAAILKNNRPGEACV